MHAQATSIAPSLPPTRVRPNRMPRMVRRGHEAGGLPFERAWRQLTGIDAGWSHDAPVFASRWADTATHRRRMDAAAPANCHVVSIALCRARVRLTCGPHQLFDGVMATGAAHVSGPSQQVTAEFLGACDFVHLYVANDRMARPDSIPAVCDAGEVLLRDPLVGHLAQTLTEGAHARDPHYVESVARTVLLRLAALDVPRTGGCALPKWRLKRVQEHVEANLSGPISLADLADVAGLSRSYFAAQFRASTGCRPHDYVVEQRIDRAKAMLTGHETPIVEVALEVGFQTQAHFSTVFKRLTGTTPGRWRVTRRDQA